MKPKGRHPDKALTATSVRGLSRPGRYADGNGLYLVVDPSEAKRWLLRTMVLGRRRDIGLGGLKLVSLAEAREKAVDYRRLARDGGDPLAEKRRRQTQVPTFAEAARTVHASHGAAWKNAKHKTQWLTTLGHYAFPVFGDRRVDQIHTPEVLKALSPIWLEKPETARRVRQRIKAILDWAKVAGHRTGDNPVEGVTRALPRQPERTGHFSALDFNEVPAFIQELGRCGAQESTKLAFELLIITATRTSEVINARWDEIDMDAEMWTIPASRMKSGREHRVPLSGRALEILQQARKLDVESEYVFPGQRPGRPLYNMAMLKLLKPMRPDATVHGFRSAFADWAAERTNFPREVCEMALAHTIRDKTEAAYRRGDLLEKRRDLMETWAAYVSSGSADVVQLRAGV